MHNTTWQPHDYGEKAVLQCSDSLHSFSYVATTTRFEGPSTFMVSMRFEVETLSHVHYYDYRGCLISCWFNESPDVIRTIICNGKVRSEDV